MKIYACFVPLILSNTSAFAASEITHLSVNEQTVRFAIGEAKAHQLPSCVQSQTKSYYNFSLESDAGRAMYSLLITALSSKLAITVESANDCMVEPTIERAKGIAFAATPSSSDGYKGIIMIYKGDGVTKVGQFVDFRASNTWWYIKPGDHTDTEQGFSIFDADVLRNKAIYFAGPNCSGKPFVRQDDYRANEPYISNSSYKDKSLFKADVNSSQAVVLKSYLSANRQCYLDYDSFVKRPQPVYELVPTIHPLCGSKSCIVRGE